MVSVNTDDDGKMELVQLTNGDIGINQGSVSVCIKLGELREQWKCLVTELLNYDLLLGRDWLRAHHAVIDGMATCANC